MPEKISVFYNSMVERWLARVDFAHRLRRALLIFFVPLISAAIIPAAITILFDNASDVRPRRLEATPTPTFPKAIPESASEDISSSWDSVRGSNDIASLFNFAVKFPDTHFANLAWARINELVKQGGLQVASLDNDVDFIASVLEHKSNTSSIIESIIETHNLEGKYPLGFAIFYADGSKILHYDAKWKDGPVAFDPSLLEMTFNVGRTVCINTLPVKVNGQPVRNFSNICFGGIGSIIHAVRFTGLATLDIEPLGEFNRGLAWVIGMRPE